MTPATEQNTSNGHKDDKADDDKDREDDVAKLSTTTHSENPDEPGDPDKADEPGDVKKADEPGDAKKADDSPTSEPSQRSGDKKGRRISVSVRSLAVGTVIIALIAAVGVMTWLYLGAKTSLDDQARQADGIKHAEQIALDYAVNAAIMDYKDLGPWKQNLVKGTTPELNAKLTKAATAMEQILLPLQWSSSAHPLAAKVRSHDNGVYVVDSFVSVMTKTAQAADGVQSTATYSITIDSNNAWLITDVGGIAAVVDNK